MKKKVINVLIVLLVFFIFDYFFYFLKSNFSNAHFTVSVEYQFRKFLRVDMIFAKLEFLCKSLFLFVILEGLLYKKLYTFSDGKIKVVMCIALPLVVAMILADRSRAIDRYYFYSKTATETCTPALFLPDQQLAHKGAPNEQGYYYYYIYNKDKVITGQVPVLFDAGGFRTIPDSLKIGSSVKDLYLGCSFTFGDYIPAEQTYPYLASRLLNHSYSNAGLSAYGLGQMYAIANKIVPTKQYHYVFIQLSPWLVFRAMELIGPTNYGYRAFPYFSEKNGSFQLSPIAFSPQNIASEKEYWLKSKKSYFDKLHFTFTDGFKVEGADYIAYKWAQLKVRMGIIPEPTKNRKQLESYFYNSLIDLCKANNAIPVILKLGYIDGLAHEGDELVKTLSEKVKVVDLDNGIKQELQSTGATYKKLFEIYHVEGKDTIYFNTHPNYRANSIFANEIFAALGDTTITKTK